MPVQDGLVAERVKLKQLTEQRERQGTSNEEPTVRKRRLQEMHERSAEKCALQEWTTDEEEGEWGGGGGVRSERGVKDNRSRQRTPIK
jgi:hypothetical protein